MDFGRPSWGGLSVREGRIKDNAWRLSSFRSAAHHTKTAEVACAPRYARKFHLQ
jgi:hypothetical protein